MNDEPLRLRRTDVTAMATRSLAKRWGSHTVLRDVTIALDAGQTCLLRGENGSGKTTLLRCLAGLLRPDSGDIELLGKSLASRGASSRCLLGVALHQSLLYPELTPRENLVFAARLCGLPSAQAAADRWLDRADLTRMTGCPTSHLSQGQRQRLALARALLHDPPLALFDEPFNALDDAARDWVVELVRERRKQGGTTLLSTHQGWPEREPVDQVFELVGGRVVTCGSSNSCGAISTRARAA